LSGTTGTKTIFPLWFFGTGEIGQDIYVKTLPGVFAVPEELGKLEEISVRISSRCDKGV
jgi:hypothetical protein